MMGKEAYGAREGTKPARSSKSGKSLLPSQNHAWRTCRVEWLDPRLPWLSAQRRHRQSCRLLFRQSLIWREGMLEARLAHWPKLFLHKVKVNLLPFVASVVLCCEIWAGFLSVRGLFSFLPLLLYDNARISTRPRPALQITFQLNPPPPAY